MKKLMLLSFMLLNFMLYSQSAALYNTDSSQVRLIGDKLYKAHQSQEYKNGDVAAVIRYTKLEIGIIKFKTSKSELLPESYAALSDLLTILKENTQFNLKINGHTDKVGPSRKNLKLSKKRAKVVERYFIKNGIDLGRIEANGYGDKSPICESPCDDNRRVEFIFALNGTEYGLPTRLKFKETFADRKKTLEARAKAKARTNK